MRQISFFLILDTLRTRVLLVRLVVVAVPLVEVPMQRRRNRSVKVVAVAVVATTEGAPQGVLQGQPSPPRHVVVVAPRPLVSPPTHIDEAFTFTRRFTVAF